MTGPTLWQRGMRAWEFARHVPLSRLTRRIEREARQRLRDRVGDLGGRDAFAPAVELCWRADAPMPILPPRGGLTRDAEGRRVFTFVNRAVTMPGPAVDWHVAGPAPSPQLWRMNLHYMEFLEALGTAEAQALMEDWIEANPWSRPGAWRDAWNSYALSLRTVVWMQQLARHGQAIAPEARSRISASLARQLNFLARNLETDLGGNHLVKNVKALLWGSACFTGADTARWRRIGLDLIERDVLHQVLADGMHDERSASYHTQVLADLVETRHALGADPLGGKLDDAILRMAQATADLAHPDGRPALFNDSGLTMAYAPADALAAVARVLGRSALLRAVFAFPAAGYFGLRAPESYLVADCGRIAPDALPAHGHADVLSFEWAVGGRRLIVDQGVHEYVAGDKRAAARSAASHNTLALDGADQADVFGAFRCGRRPNVEVRRYEARADGFVLEGAHDGYSHLPGRPMHVRRFEVSPLRVRIDDRIEGRTDRRATISFLLAPDVHAEVVAQGATLSCGGRTIRVSTTAALAIEPAVWWPDMGLELPTRRLRVALPSDAPEVMTVLEIAP